LFEVIRAQYQSELDEQLKEADSDTSIYRIQQSFDKWTSLRQAMENFESNPCDPGLVLPPARHRFRRIPDVYQLRRGPYIALYRRYVNSAQAIAFPSIAIATVRKGFVSCLITHLINRGNFSWGYLNAAALPVHQCSDFVGRSLRRRRDLGRAYTVPGKWRTGWRRCNRSCLCGFVFAA
jgi:hypothetical protein